MKESDKIKDQLISHLQGGEAFLPIEEMLKEIPFEKLGERPGNLPYSFFELFYHIRFAQKDILDYCLSLNYRSPNWPKDYWPERSKPDKEENWENIKRHYFDERKQLIDLIMDPNTELTKPVGENPEHTILREVLLVIEHTAYHCGQLLVVLRNLNLHG